MGLFKEIHCEHCGKKTGMLTRVKLADGTYVCSACKAGIPGYIHLSDYTYTDFLNLKAYLEESATTLKKQFRENHYFSQIHLDTEHELFYIDSLGKPLYLKLEDLEEFSLDFTPDELKEGLLSSKVTGKLTLTMKMGHPYFFREEILDSSAKASAQVKGVFSKKAVYNNPKGMDDFLQFFNSAWNRALEKKQRRLFAEAEQLLRQTEAALNEPF